jgi:Fe-S-cluster containining protein
MALDEHQLDEYGDHDSSECELCIERDHTVCCECRCGKCCEQLLIEVSMRDGEREPLIKEKGQPIYDFLPEEGGEQAGWLLNGPNGHCVFFDPQSRLCTIHETRPLCCRLFNCDKPMSSLDS